MDNNFQNMLDSIPNEAWEYWQHEKRHGKPPEFPDARIVIKIAQWRATEVMKQQEIENWQMDAYIQMRDMLSSLKLENKLIIDPEKELETIELYRNPERLRDIFRSKTLDMLLDIEIARAAFQYENSYQLRRLLFPYLRPYDLNSQ